ncbi:hypothetical protein Bca4012_057929 [Brassica carinata]
MDLPFISLSLGPGGFAEISLPRLSLFLLQSRSIQRSKESLERGLNHVKKASRFDGSMPSHWLCFQWSKFVLPCMFKIIREVSKITGDYSCTSEVQRAIPVPSALPLKVILFIVFKRRMQSMK